MANHYPIFMGGMYVSARWNVGDNGLYRRWLSCSDAEQLMIDPEFQAVAQTALGVNFNLNNRDYRTVLEQAQVGDYLYMMLLPPLLGYRGFWATPKDYIPGLILSPEVVSICDVANIVYCNKPLSDLDNLPSRIPSYPIDFNYALGNAVIDAIQLGQGEQRPWTDFRRGDAGIAEYLPEPFILKRNEGSYLRFKILSKPAMEHIGCCAGCGCHQWGRFDAGFIVDRTCMILNESMYQYCACIPGACGSCKATVCHNCPDETVPTSPEVTPEIIVGA